MISEQTPEGVPETARLHGRILGLEVILTALVHSLGEKNGFDTNEFSDRLESLVSKLHEDVAIEPVRQSMNQTIQEVVRFFRDGVPKI